MSEPRSYSKLPDENYDSDESVYTTGSKQYLLFNLYNAVEGGSILKLNAVLGSFVTPDEIKMLNKYELFNPLINTGEDTEIDKSIGKLNILSIAILHYNPSVGLDIIKILIGKGIVIDSKNNDGSTALTIAAEMDYLEVFKLLLENGANINHTYKYGHYEYNAFQRSAASVNGTKVLQYLLETPPDAFKLEQDDLRDAVVYAAVYCNADAYNLLITHKATKLTKEQLTLVKGLRSNVTPCIDSEFDANIETKDDTQSAGERTKTNLKRKKRKSRRQKGVVKKATLKKRSKNKH